MSEFKVSIEEPKKDFEIHLSHEGNNRILFSAPFGTGKTYFLKEFFKDKEKYDVVRLYPVNYSVASNEDIFELIKHDILFELLKKDDLDIDDEEFSDLFIAQNFLYENPIDIIKPFIENTSELGKSIVPIFDSLKKLQNKYKLFKEQVNKNDTLSAFQYLKSFQGKKGSVYEQDFYTELIRNLVQQLNGKGKETVLIIDDLDRIDPEHIFRLLNVFAAHFDHNDSENKFAFSKIIFVTDVVNLKSIFATKYGEKTDFSGYLNKFFSLNVFVFDNLESILTSIRQLYKTLLPYNENSYQPLSYKDDDYNWSTINSIISVFVKSGKLTLRSLVKLNSQKILFEDEKIKAVYSDKFGLKKSSFFIIPIFEFISFLFGSHLLMEQAFNDCKSLGEKEYFSGSTEQFIIQCTIPIIDIRNNKLVPNSYNYQIQNGLSNFQVSYKIETLGFGQLICSSSELSFLSQNPKDGVVCIMDLFYQTLKILQSDFDLFKS